MSKVLRKDILKKKAQTILLQAVYPAIVTFLKTNYTNEDIIGILKRIGSHSAFTMIKEWKPKGKSIEKVVKEIFKVVFNNKKVKIKKDKQGNYKIIDRACRLCWEAIEEKEIHYCVIASSFIEQFVNFKSEIYFLPKIKVETVKSKAAGDKHCEHYMEIVER